jgi:translation initiation factor 2 alpha subunit (eIF-2alpha)
MSQDSTRKLLREFGVAVTAFEDAVEAGQGDAARKAEGALREHLKGLIELVERLSEQAAKL